MAHFQPLGSMGEKDGKKRLFGKEFGKVNGKAGNVYGSLRVPLSLAQIRMKIPRHFTSEQFKLFSTRPTAEKM
jgi:hypothetical protein